MTELEIKAAVRERDGHQCTECGYTGAEHLHRYGSDLEVHRLTPGSPYTVEGSVSLCRVCHGPKPRRPRRSVGLFAFRLAPDLARKLRTLAAWKGMTVGQFVRGLISEAVTELAKILKDQASGQD